MDEGSSLSVIYLATLDALQVPSSTIKPTYKPFYRIGPIMKVQPMGQVTLPMIFDFEMYYNAIIDLPAMVKFICVPHYAYQILKMLGLPKIIKILGNPKSGVWCNKKSLDIIKQNTSLDKETGAQPSEDDPSKSEHNITTKPQEESLLKAWRPFKPSQMGSTFDAR